MFHEGADVFGRDALSASIKDQATAVRLDAYSLFGLKESKKLAGKDLANLLFVVSPKEILLREFRVGVEVDVLIAKRGANFVKEILGSQGELGKVQLWGTKSDHGLSNGPAVLPTAGHIPVRKYPYLNLVGAAKLS